MADTPLMSLKTTLGEGKLRLHSMSALEEMGRPFEFDVRAVADPRTTIDVAALLGTKASVEVELPAGKPRVFHGIVASAGLGDGGGDLVGYRLVLRPWLWLATRRSDSRFFLKKTAEAIIKEVLDPYSADFKFELGGALPAYEYCAQYRESDFNFVSRLMEQEGLHYYFSHDADKHTLHIVDKLSAATVYPGHAKIKFRQSLDASIGLEAITEWRSQHEIQPGKVALTDFNFETPSTSLLQKANSTVGRAPANLELYDQPGGYAKASDGSRVTGIRRDELDARHHQVNGSCNVRGLACGYRFELEEHPLAAQNAAHVVTATRIDLSHAGYESGQGRFDYRCRFSVVRADSTYRAQRLTPKPVVSGPQTAVVVGPKGADEIHTDEYGRVKVQFHWDRLSSRDETSSCWIRVASPWAGQGWGMISLPRIGQEVIVDFLEGDPDRPIITGRVYNAQQVTPYALPDNKTVSTIKSRSANGDASSFNELRFEDKAGNEEVFLQAQKDFIHNVKNDSHTHVLHDQSLRIDNNRTEQVKVNYELKVGMDFVKEVGGISDTTVGGDAAFDFGKAVAVSIKDAAALAVDKAADVTVQEDLSIESNGKVSLKTGKDTHIKSGINFAVDAAGNVHIKAGANVVIEAGANLTLKGGAMVHIEGSAPVSIKGAMVLINSGGAATPGSGASPKSPAKPAKPKKFDKISDAVEKAAKKHSEPRKGKN